jgi:integrase
MPAITKRTVDDATPGAKDAFLWDSALKGFGLKITSAGAKVYIVQYRTGGRGTPTKRVTIGRHGAPWTPDQARRRAREILGQVAAGSDPAAEKRAEKEAAKRQPVDDGRTIEAVAARWFASLRRDGKRSADEVERSFKRHVYPELGARRIETIKKSDAYALYEKLADAGHAPMGHQLTRNLRAMLSFAVDRFDDDPKMPDMNPLLRLKIPNLSSRDRVLIKFHPEREPDPAELFAVWLAADQLEEPYRSYTKVLILSCQREDEVGDMTWGEIDGSLWSIPKERHKGKRGHDVPLPPQVVEIIEAMPRVSEFVFPGRGGRPIGDFDALKQDLQRLSGTTGWRPHDLRRTGSSWIEEEFGAEVMKAALGHSLGDKLTKTYARGSGYRRKKCALQSWADFVTGAAAEQANNSNVVPMLGRR